MCGPYWRMSGPKVRPKQARTAAATRSAAVALIRLACRGAMRWNADAKRQTRQWSRQFSCREAAMLRTVIVALVLAMPSASHAQDGGRLAAAASAMGAANLNSIEYTGSGFMFGFGQAYEPGERWPRFVQRSYTAAINYQTPGMRLTTLRAQGEHPPRGGAQQALAGEQRAVLVVSDKHAWQEGPQAVPTPGAVADRLRQMWTTPHGVIKAALANAGRVDGSTITFSIAGRAIKASL